MKLFTLDYDPARPATKALAVPANSDFFVGISPGGEGAVALIDQDGVSISPESQYKGRAVFNLKTKSPGRQLYKVLFDNAVKQKIFFEQLSDKYPDGAASGQIGPIPVPDEWYGMSIGMDEIDGRMAPSTGLFEPGNVYNNVRGVIQIFDGPDYINDLALAFVLYRMGFVPGRPYDTTVIDRISATGKLVSNPSGIIWRPDSGTEAPKFTLPSSGDLTMIIFPEWTSSSTVPQAKFTLSHIDYVSGQAYLAVDSTNKSEILGYNTNIFGTGTVKATGFYTDGTAFEYDAYTR